MNSRHQQDNGRQRFCIVMFARAPVAGRVKTRLVPVLGEQGALQLHMHLVTQQIAMLNKCNAGAIQLWVDADPDNVLFTKFNGEIHTQEGGDLGNRMSHAATEVLKLHTGVVIIGSDCPALDVDYLGQALAALEKGENDIVLGPAVDGGYVLIGLKHPHNELFTAIDWGTDRVLEQTLARAEKLGLRYQALAALQDIDTPEDLKTLL